jgi:hypothetical protein
VSAPPSKQINQLNEQIRLHHQTMRGLAGHLEQLQRQRHQLHLRRLQLGADDIRLGEQSVMAEILERVTALAEQAEG